MILSSELCDCKAIKCKVITKQIRCSKNTKLWIDWFQHATLFVLVIQHLLKYPWESHKNSDYMYSSWYLFFRSTCKERPSRKAKSDLILKSSLIFGYLWVTKKRLTVLLFSSLKVYLPCAQDTTGVKQYSEILTLRALSQQCNDNNIDNNIKYIFKIKK